MRFHLAVVPALLAASSVPALATAEAVDAAQQDATRDQVIIVTGHRSEGTDTYGVESQRTATRLPLSQRETPQSVSVVTRAQIDDFKLNDVNALLTTVPGVTVLAAETDRVYYSARGFDIQTFQIDGVGLPFAFGIQTGSLDTAIYDRIEVVRGAPGLLSSTGNPSAVINFIRKRPYRDTRLAGSVQYGSFDNLRLDADVSVPITSGGGIRARAVGAYLRTGSHLDRYNLTRWTGYGIVEADLGPDTVLSAGYGFQDHQSRNAMWGAIPLYYTDGTRIDFPRSANPAPDWARWNVTDRQIFGDLAHNFGNDWTARVTVLRRATSEDNELFYVYGNPVRGAPGGIDLLDPTGPKAIFSYPGKFGGETRNLTIEAYVSGKVSIGGRDHDIVLGANRGAQSYLQYSAYDYSQVGVPLPLDTLFDGNFPRPAFPALDLSLDQHTQRLTAYGLFRANLTDEFKLMLGGNYTHASSDGVSYGTPQNFDSAKFLPFVGATYDLTNSISAYASYATIFRPQVELDAANRILPPVEGDNLEAGLKGDWFGGRLYASAAVFRARQNNTAFGQFDPALGRTVYTPVDATSTGIEVEIGGTIVEGLQATGGFTVTRIRDESDRPERTFVPRNTGRLNLTYTLPALPQLKLGASAQYQSSFYFVPGGTSVTTGQPIRLDQGAYALIDLLARYEVTDNVAVSVNVRNVTDARYLSSLTFDQSYYGTPRSVLGTLSVKY
ncbi:MAG: TonB-dependent siderophore receptor [Altererythrobacter sp.]|nr:TonB-dependent siderophore receptor [Altererythrobacter sp.]